ncbi:MAG: glycosyltransferase family 4 protein [Chloroflexi bacterium]|nr:glycosyltransferase family 4 protein [Chloroflexota bacterium]MCI0579657.1 glycosyltransferase family 4 protein [Chloroflexota bacterium]MCI0645903.1 glycosyltransferase family 4 protein [Chloroflexota bacterium]MCI0725758.1 glycosyltransferase family 4 protein [Chloroflexota bacterium]
MATGAAGAPPSRFNPAIRWIFSTSLTEAEWPALPPHAPWRAGQPLRLVTVGRLEPIKNTAATLYALAEIQKAYPQVSLDVVGDGSCLASLKQLVRFLGLEASVTFHGSVHRRRVLEIVAGDHVFVLPSFVEGFPKAALEAMACGLPVVATAVSALPHLVGTKNGILLETPTAGAVARAIRELLAGESSLAQMSAGAQSTARHYTLERWRDTIGERLAESWGPLRQPAGREPVAPMFSGVT